MLLEVRAHNRNKKDLISYYIQDRLQKGLETYYKSISASLDSLKKYDEKNVLKKLTKK